MAKAGNAVLARVERNTVRRWTRHWCCSVAAAKVSSAAPSSLLVVVLLHASATRCLALTVRTRAHNIHNSPTTCTEHSWLSWEALYASCKQTVTRSVRVRRRQHTGRLPAKQSVSGICASTTVRPRSPPPSASPPLPTSPGGCLLQRSRSRDNLSDNLCSNILFFIEI
ncbi:hypothetical protein E2C01_050983 [Portunus trituberculatus]|uniref:Uncharacterized protein n=1 Tax=Portunus trituberculatus TaxID=210409 RepID=A0A5B7GHX8_PORTR|nr:hypothetical protein [Portunus trituberculatus]